MMDPITLQQCVPEHIYPRKGDNPPQNVVVHLNVGGSAGDGSVQVHSGGPGGPVIGSVATGSSGDVPAPGARDLWIHYVAPGESPQEVEVTYVLDVG